MGPIINLKLNLGDMWCQCIDWIQLPQDEVAWRMTVMKLSVPIKRKDFYAS